LCRGVETRAVYTDNQTTPRILTSLLTLAIVIKIVYIPVHNQRVEIALPDHGMACGP
jgi:hypothetical protein